MRNHNIQRLTRIPLMTAVIAVCALIAIPMPTGVPLTLQVFAAALAGLILGAKNGTCAVLIYLALGGVGLPVFSGFTGGAAALFGVTGGYLWGFLPLAALCGLGKGRKEYIQWALAAAGAVLCHVFGAAQLSFVMDIPIAEAFLIGSAPYIIKDALSLCAAFAVSAAMRKVNANY